MWHLMHDRLIYWWPGARSNPYRAPINTAWIESLCTMRAIAELLIQKYASCRRFKKRFRVTFCLESQKKRHTVKEETVPLCVLNGVNYWHTPNVRAYTHTHKMETLGKKPPTENNSKRTQKTSNILTYKTRPPNPTEYHTQHNPLSRPTTTPPPHPNTCP